MTKNHSARKGVNIQGTRKRRQLLEAAGKAFGEMGYAGTTIRDIDEIANVQPSALIYHFDNKENLFRATLRYHIIENANLEKLADVFDSIDGSNPQEFANALLETTKSVISAFHGPKGRVPHLTGLLISMLIDGDKLTNKMVQELGSKAMEKITASLVKIKPNLTDTDLFWWRQLYWALIFYTLFGEQMLLARMGEKKYPKEFLDTLALRVTKACCRRLDLPIPTGEDTWQLPNIMESIAEVIAPFEK